MRKRKNIGYVFVINSIPDTYGTKAVCEQAKKVFDREHQHNNHNYKYDTEVVKLVRYSVL